MHSIYSIVDAKPTNKVVKAKATAFPELAVLTQSAHGSFSLPGMHMEPVSGSTSHLALAFKHTCEFSSLSHGPSSHMLSTLWLSTSSHLRVFVIVARTVITHVVDFVALDFFALACIHILFEIGFFTWTRKCAGSVALSGVIQAEVFTAG